MATPISAILNETECRDLRVALLRNCECQRDYAGSLLELCPGHAEWFKDEPLWLNHLHFARTLAARLVDEEWLRQAA